MDQPIAGSAEFPTPLGAQVSSNAVPLGGDNIRVFYRKSHQHFAGRRGSRLLCVHAALGVLLSVLAVTALLLSCFRSDHWIRRRENADRRLAGWDDQRLVAHIVEMCVEMEEEASRAAQIRSSLAAQNGTPADASRPVPPPLHAQSSTTSTPPALGPQAHPSPSTSPEPPVPHPGACMWGDLGLHLWDVAVRSALVVLEDPDAGEPESAEQAGTSSSGAARLPGPPRPPLSPVRATGKPQQRQPFETPAPGAPAAPAAFGIPAAPASVAAVAAPAVFPVGRHAPAFVVASTAPSAPAALPAPAAVVSPATLVAIAAPAALPALPARATSANSAAFPARATSANSAALPARAISAAPAALAGARTTPGTSRAPATAPLRVRPSGSAAPAAPAARSPTSGSPFFRAVMKRRSSPYGLLSSFLEYYENVRPISPRQPQGTSSRREYQNAGEGPSATVNPPQGGQPPSKRGRFEAGPPGVGRGSREQSRHYSRGETEGRPPDEKHQDDSDEDDA